MALKSESVYVSFDNDGMQQALSSMIDVSQEKSIVRCLGDIVDNSIDAGATEIKFLYSKTSKTLTVSDNGRGMSYENLKDYFRFGDSAKTGNLIGHYGAGGKIACISLGDSYSIFTVSGNQEAVAKVKGLSDVSLAQFLSPKRDGTSIKIDLKSAVNKTLSNNIETILQKLVSLYYDKRDDVQFFYPVSPGKCKVIYPQDGCLADKAELINNAKGVINYKDNVISIEAYFIPQEVMEANKRWLTAYNRGGAYIRMHSSREVVTADHSFFEQLTEDRISFSNLRVLIKAKNKTGIKPTLTKDGVNMDSQLQSIIQGIINNVIIPAYLQIRDNEIQKIEALKNEKLMKELGSILGRLFKTNGKLAQIVEKQLSSIKRSGSSSSNSSKSSTPRNNSGVEINLVSAPKSNGAIYVEVVEDSFRINLNVNFEFINNFLNKSVPQTETFLKTVVLPESLLKIEVLQGRENPQTYQEALELLDQFREIANGVS